MQTSSEILNISKQFARELNTFKEEVIKLHKSKCDPNDSRQNEKLARKEASFTLTSSDDMSDEIYLCFLSKYPRDIVSGYYSFHDFLKELLGTLKGYYSSNSDYKFSQDVSDEFLKAVQDSCINFIYSIVLSNRNLKLFSKHLSELVLEKRMHWQIFVNYPLVFDTAVEFSHIEKNQINPTPFIEMICLLNFVEQLIVQVIPIREYHHGYKELQEILDLCCIEVVKKTNIIYVL